MRALKIGALVALYLAAIVAANIITTRYGVQAVYYVAFGLIGLDLVTRDRLADFWGTTRWAKMALLIAVGGALSYWVNRDAATIAIASTIAFAGSETIEAAAYHIFRHRPWNTRAPQAATLGAITDSVLFITIAFGFSLEVIFLQIACKVFGAVAWTWIIGRLLPPPRMAPEVAA